MKIKDYLLDKKRERQILHNYLEVLAHNVESFSTDDADKLSESFERIHRVLNPSLKGIEMRFLLGSLFANLCMCFLILIKKFLRG